MADKDLQIKITTTADTSGADAAAKALKEIEAAPKADLSLPKTDISDLNERLDALRERAEAAGKEAKALGEHWEKVGEQAKAAEPNLEKLVSFERLESIGRVGRGFERMGEGLAKANPALEETGEKLTMLGGTMAGFAEGFRIGGPFGGAIGALVGGFAEPLKKAFTEMSEAEQKAAESAKKAEQSFVELQRERENHAAKVIATDASEALERETEALKNWSIAAQSAMRVWEANQQADAAEWKLKDQQAIQGGEDPYNRAMNKAARDANENKNKLDLTLQFEREKYAELQKSADKSAEALRKYEADPSTKKDDKETERFRNEAKTAAEKSDDQKRKLVETESVTSAGKRKIDAERDLAILMAQTAQAKAREEADKKAEKAKQDEEKRQAEAEMAREKARLATDSGSAAGMFANAAARAGNSSTNAAFRGISGKLGNSTDSNEMAEIQRQFDAAVRGSTSATVTQMRSMLASLAKQAAEISKLQSQISNLRSAK